MQNYVSSFSLTIKRLSLCDKQIYKKIVVLNQI